MDAEVRAEARSRALIPAAQHTLAPAHPSHESGALLIRGAARPPRPAAHVVPRRSGPRSFLMQFLVAMVASVVLVSTLALATPLGQGMAAATGNTFTTSAGTFLWVPTPTPTPKPKPSVLGPPKGVNPGTQVIINEIKVVFGQYSTGALNIARCESGYDPNAINSYPIGNSHASGVFQILYPSTWNTTSYAAYSPFDYAKNIRAAWEIFHRDGNSWREWACKPY
jgi:Transglycosylase SLT domain